MTYAMLSVETVLKAADAAMNRELDANDLDGLSAITRVSLIAALARAASQEAPAVTTMAVSVDDFALLSSEWEKAGLDTARPGTRPTLVTSCP